MLKRITFFSFLLLFAMVAFASTDEAGNSDEILQIFKPSKVTATPQQWGAYIDTQNYRKKDFNNFYIGAAGGGSVNSYKFSGHTENAFDPYASVSFGYGGKLENMYLGLALDVSYNWAKYDKDGLKIKKPYSVGAYLVPGLFITKNTLLYFKLGGAFSQLKQSGIDHISKHLWGLRGGVGFRVYLDKSFSIDTEYMFSYYEKVKPKTLSKYTPYTNQFSIGFALHF
jgi:hypothetical protein